MSVKYDLTGKTAIVTGGAKGIGKSIVELLTASGARVHVWDINAADSNSATWTKVDVTDRVQISNAVSELIGRGAKIDILVNNAGYLGTYHAFDEHDPGDWFRIIQVNLVGMMQTAQAILPHMRRWGSGRSSIWVRSPEKRD